MIELVLVHHGVCARAGPGAGEEIEDVAQPGFGPVEEIFALAGAIETTAHRDLAPRHRERSVVAERQLDFGEPDRLVGRRAVKDHVLHPLAAEHLRALLAEGPADGVGQVALATAVRADDGGDAGQDFDDRAFAEGLEAVQDDGLEAHRNF